MDVRQACKEVELPWPKEFDKLADVLKMSTFRIGRIINWIVSQMPADQQYVNVGVWHGFSLFAGMVGNPDKKCVGVDNFSLSSSSRISCRQDFIKFGSAKHDFFEMGMDEYFKKYHSGKIGFYFYDADHSYPAQLRGLELAEPFMADDCLIMVDDTNQEYPKQATLDFMKQSKYNYEIIIDEMTERPYDTEWWNGIMIIQKKGLKLIEVPEEKAEDY